MPPEIALILPSAVRERRLSARLLPVTVSGRIARPRAPDHAREWASRATGVLREQGGAGLVAWLRGQRLPAGEAEDEAPLVVIGYFLGAAHRAGYSA